ncbi:MAG: alanine dehydrogenase [Pseudohongiellaceae bacterium]
MRIGVPQEVKTEEYRVGLTPAAVVDLTDHGHEVFIERGAGVGAGFEDEQYRNAGASLMEDAASVFEAAQLIVKVKEPQPREVALLRPDHLLFTYLHLAADAGLTQSLCDSGATCIAYETVTDSAGRLPLLVPMSQIAGRLSVQAGATHLERPRGGRGVLLGGATGVPPGKVTIIGGGTVGGAAIRIALGMGANVCVLDKSMNQLEQLSQRFGSRLTTIYASSDNLHRHVVSADLVIGAVLVPGATAARLITADMIRSMTPGSVMVDVAVDQGGCCENTRPTTHADPTFIVDGVVHYCVANMPGAVPATASEALGNATLPHVLALADKGLTRALEDDEHLENGVNIRDGKVTHPAVRSSLGL